MGGSNNLIGNNISQQETHVQNVQTTVPSLITSKAKSNVLSLIRRGLGKQKHKNNYNRLDFLIYLLHILRSISTDFSLLQEW